MTSDFDTVFSRLIPIEGGYANRGAADPGGETRWGITIAVAREYGYTGEMSELPLEVAKDIYRRKYWNYINGDALPLCIAEFLFDYAVNSGEHRAAVALQHAVGALPDGKVGPKTIALVATHSPRHILRLVFTDRAKVFAHSPVLDENENGWFSRLFDVTVRAVDEGATT